MAFLGDGSVVGNQGRAEAMVDPINTVYSAKRLIGRAFESHQVQDAMRVLPYEVVRGNEQQPFIEIRGETYAIPEVSGMVLRRMKDGGKIFGLRCIKRWSLCRQTSTILSDR